MYACAALWVYQKQKGSEMSSQPEAEKENPSMT